MNRTQRTLLAVVAGLAALALGGVLVVPRLLDGERYRLLLENRLSNAVGRQVRLGGVRLSLFPGLALRVDRLEVAGLPEEGGGDLLVADGLRVRARLLPLLRGRLEVTSAQIARPRLLLVRDAAGDWNVERLLAERRAAQGGGRGDGDGGATDAAPRQASRRAIDRVGFADARVTIVDRTAEPPVELVLTDLELDLEGLASAGGFETALDTRFDGAPEARLRWRGTVGPLGAAGQPFALRGQGEVNALDAGLLARLARLAGLDLEALAGRLEAVSGQVEVEAAFPERAALRGDLDLGVVEVSLPADGEPRTVELEVGTRFDLATERGAELLRFASLEIDLDDVTLAFAGTIESVSSAASASAPAPSSIEAPTPPPASSRRAATTAAATRRVDLTLRPARLPADRLAALVAIALPELPFSFSSPEPLEVEGRIHGGAGPGQRPGIEGRLAIADLRFVHESMTRPIEHVEADVAFAADRVKVSGLQATIGDSDLRGEVQIEGFDPPRVRFDLASRRADFDQLFAALEGDHGRAAAGAEGNGDLLDRVEAEGRIRVDQASWGDLEGADLTATVRLENGTVTLDPLTAGLYAGRFEGRVDAWPGRTPLPFRLQGIAAGVSVDRFLAGALDLEDRLAGSFSGTLQASGSAGDWGHVARSLEGQGEMRIEDGEVASFPLLRSVARVSGVFGEQGLAEIADRLADSATRFAELRGAFRLAGGTMTFDQLTLQSADYTLRGAGAVDLVSGALRGDAAMTFSAALSELMREQDSRAAELFSSPDDGRVRLPLGLRGALAVPSATVDWEAAVQSYAERRLGEEVERQVGKLLGRLLGGEPTPTPSPEPSPP
jgi:uncharacterized protein involved in outer membrane biogenesis